VYTKPMVVFVSFKQTANEIHCILQLVT